jgi:hypothetical protein
MYRDGEVIAVLDICEDRYWQANVAGKYLRGGDFLALVFQRGACRMDGGSLIL